jgi:hypothetical protein
MKTFYIWRICIFLWWSGLGSFMLSFCDNTGCGKLTSFFILSLPHPVCLKTYLMYI